MEELRKIAKEKGVSSVSNWIQTTKFLYVKQDR